MGSREKSGGHDIVCIGCSAGGVEAVTQLLGQLPKRTPASIFVVMHLAPETPSLFPEIISRAAHLPAIHPRDGERFAPGCIYVAPPDFHLLIDDKKIHLSHGPKENRHRPAVDPLFRSAAQYHGARVIGIVLSGSLDDGTAGLQAIQRCGGITVAQHPDDAMAPGMPTSALRHVSVEHCLPVSRLRSLLPRLIRQPPGKAPAPGCHESASIINQDQTMTIPEMETRFGTASGLICPECSGPIWETAEGKVTQFRCLVGHIYSPESFVAEEAAAAERALWVAVKTLQERASLLRRLSGKAMGLSQTISGANFRQQAEECDSHAEVIRNILRRINNNSSNSNS